MNYPIVCYDKGMEFDYINFLKEEPPILNPTRPEYDNAGKCIGIWHEGIYIPIQGVHYIAHFPHYKTGHILDSTAMSVEEWRTQRKANIASWLNARDVYSLRIYNQVLEQCPQIEGCFLRTPFSLEEADEINKFGGKFISYNNTKYGFPTIVTHFAPYQSSSYFLTHYPSYIEYLAEQLETDYHELYTKPQIIDYYLQFHEYGHAAHFFNAFASRHDRPFIDNLVDYDSQYSSHFLRLVTSSTKEHVNIDTSDWEKKYWNMPFEKEANDFAVPLMKTMLEQGIIDG